MVQFEELKSELSALKPQLESLKDAININFLNKQINDAQEQASLAGFWDNPQTAQKILEKASHAKSKLNKFISLEKSYNDTLDLITICDMEEDLSLVQEIKSQIKNIVKDLENQTISTLLTGEYDKNNAILTFHAGAGGTEAQDWVEMLYRMYSRFAERHGYKVKLLDFLDGE